MKCEKTITQNVVKTDETVSIHFTFFTFCSGFCVFPDKCIAGLRVRVKNFREAGSVCKENLTFQKV